jgi:S-DNA-T family DNA segregation ATPase FtsK/SpoIIIE
VAALGLTALTAFLAISLATYHRADPPGDLIYPPGGEVSNACGRAGAWAADLMLSGLGMGAWYLVASLAVVDFLLLTRRTINEPVTRTAGWLLSLFAWTTLAAMALGDLWPGPVIGAGGYLGAAGRGWLEMHFARAGAYILVGCALFGGLLLCTDYLLLRILSWSLGVPAASATRRMFSSRDDRSKKPETAKAKAKRTDVATDDDEDLATVRIRGKGIEPAAAESPKNAEPPKKGASVAGNAVIAAETKTDAAAAEEEADGEPKGKEGLASRLASALRIKPPMKKAEREAVMRELDAASRIEEANEYELPSIDLLLESEEYCLENHEQEVRRKAKILEQTFANFGFNIKVVEIETGPVIAQYEVELEAGLRLSKITSLADDVAIALRVPSVRIVAPIPGKNTVGIEVPNAERHLVRLREVIEESGGKAAKMRIPVFLGKDVAGNPMVVDLTTLPHLLIAGRTGTGKSVCLNTLIMSMLMTRRPDEVKMLLIDPKMVELTPYTKLPHLMHPVVTDMKKAEAILAWAVDKMEERYSLLARAGVRHISVYNQLGEEELMERLQPESDEERELIPTNLPYIVIVADEMADLMMTAAKEVETHIIRLAQKSRAVGIHLVLATQKPTVDVITGLIKSNLPARIAFQVASRVDSRVVLDEMGADKLLGNGDLLFLWPGTSTLLRGQGAYVSDDEINRVVEVVGTVEPQFSAELVQLQVKRGEGAEPGQLKNRDDLYEAAVDMVIREGRGSVSLLQRSLGIGYGRAARLIDYMAEDGIVGQYNGSQAREVLITLEQWAEMTGQEEAAEAPPPKRKPRNKISPAAASRSTPVEAEDEPAENEDSRVEAEDDLDASDEEDEGDGADADELDAGEVASEGEDDSHALSASPRSPALKFHSRTAGAGRG